MKTLIALCTALLLSFVAPVYAASPEPVSKGHRHKMMTMKKKKPKKHGKKKKMSRRNKKGCGLGES